MEGKWGVGVYRGRGGKHVKKQMRGREGVGGRLGGRRGSAVAVGGGEGENER